MLPKHLCFDGSPWSCTTGPVSKPLPPLQGAYPFPAVDTGKEVYPSFKL